MEISSASVGGRFIAKKSFAPQKKNVRLMSSGMTVQATSSFSEPSTPGGVSNSERRRYLMAK